MSKRFIAWSITVSMSFVLAVIGIIKGVDLTGLALIITALSGVAGVYQWNETKRESTK